MELPGKILLAEGLTGCVSDLVSAGWVPGACCAGDVGSS